jgi:glyoxylase-like metal-dependent hydrolase (beta-lactamase superfamily II)
MKIKAFVFNPFYENTYIISDESKECLIIDPGCYEKHEIDEVIAYVKDNKLTAKGIVNTHCHIDHVLGNYALKEHFKCPLSIPEGEVDVYKAVEVYALQYGITNFTWIPADKLLGKSGEIKFGKTALEILYVPGHSPGHLMFYNKKTNEIIGGDVLFRQSIGRTDLPGGNHKQLLTNIRKVLYTLADDVVVHPGHGPETTIGFEKENNPFVKA